MRIHKVNSTIMIANYKKIIYQIKYQTTLLKTLKENLLLTLNLMKKQIEQIHLMKVIL